MYVSYKVNCENIDEVAKGFKLLGNSKHLRIILLLKDKPMPLDEIHETMEQKKVYSHRETTYKALEKRVEGKLITKEYDANSKKLVYDIKSKTNLKIK